MAAAQWRALVDAELASSDDVVFYRAAHAADALGIDATPGTGSGYSSGRGTRRAGSRRRLRRPRRG